MAPELFDTHCHIQSAARNGGERTTSELWAKAGDITDQAILQNADDAGVKTMVCVGCDVLDSELAVSFVQDKPSCYASIGIHPHEAQRYRGDTAALDAFATLLTKPKVIAVGECGLDYFYGHSPEADQAEVLRFQLELAQAYDLPVIFHVREAFADFWPILDSFKGIRGVLHSFTDSRENLDKAIERGLYIGVNGIATFAKNPAQQEMYTAIPLDKLVLETDAPFLTPTPYRGTINEPKYVRVVSDFLASKRDLSPQDLATVTTSNARRLFSL